jgi:hypothetical protein
MAIPETHVTPAPGSPTITMIAVTSISSALPDYFHLSGHVRFKVTSTDLAAG